MIHTKTVIIPETTKEVVTHKSCDFCDGVIEQRKSFEFNEITIEQRKGQGYYDGGGETTTTTFDCCPNCWTTKIIPILAVFGTPRSEYTEH